MLNAFDVINLFYVTAILLFLYSSKKNSLYISIVEFTTAFLFGLIFETFNIQNAHYSYPYSYFYIGQVPISIIVTWYTIFIFGKYWTQSILYFYSLNQSNRQKKYHFIPLSILLTGVIASTFALVIDPIATRLRWWEWYEAAPFLGVPIGEFYGIFIAICLLSSIYWILYFILSNYIKKDSFKITFSDFQKIDFLPFVLYEIIILLLGYWSYLASSNSQDVLNGALVPIIATQIIVFIWLTLLIDTSNVLKVDPHYTQKLYVLVLLLILIGALFFISTLLVVFFQFYKNIKSIHMIFFALSLCFTLIGISLFLKINTKQRSY